MRDFNTFGIILQTIYMATAYMNIKHGNPGRTLNPAVYRAKIAMYLTQILSAIGASVAFAIAKDNFTATFWAGFACFSVYMLDKHIKLKNLFFGPTWDIGRADNKIRYMKADFERELEKFKKEVERINKIKKQ